MNCGKVNVWKTQMIDKGDFVRFVMQTQVVSGDELFSSTFTNGNLSPSQKEMYALPICL